MNDVLLINPWITHNVINHEPLNLLFLASWLKNKGMSVSIFDEIAGQDDLANRVLNTRYVGITSNTCTYPRALELKKRIKELDPQKTIVIGGVHPSVLPEETLNDGFDIVVQGDGEKALHDIVCANEKSGVFQGEPLDSDEFVPLDRSLVDMDFYANTKIRCAYEPNLNYIPSGKKVAVYVSSRGCPFRCTFCHNGMGNTGKMTFLPTDTVIEELARTQREYGINHFRFIDDHFFFDRQRALSICRSIIDSGLKICWGASSRVNYVDDEVLDTAYAAGCRAVSFGFESGSQRMLDVMNKGTTVEQNYESIELCHKHGFRVVGYMLIGSPTETMEDIRKTSHFIMTSGIDDLTLSILTPFPGTQIWKMCIEEGRIPDKVDFSKFYFVKAPVQITDHISPHDLEKLKRKMLIRFYLKPKKLFSFGKRLLHDPKSFILKISEFF